MQLWDAATGKQKAILKDFPDPINDIAIFPDGKRLAIVVMRWGNVIRHWNMSHYLDSAPTKKEIQTAHQQFGLTLKKIDIGPSSLPEKGDSIPEEPSRWQTTHPFYWMAKAQ
ncbi:hypothetical protein MNBD_PLANCTO02-1557, partial [hydrothermal vent metagenome]